MDLLDSPAQARFRTELRAFLRERLPVQEGGKPLPRLASGLREWSKPLYEAGYAGLTWPVEFGGRGLSADYQAIFAEECTLAGAPDELGVIGLHMVGPTLIRHGTAQQQERHLPAILRGDHIFCQGFSESEAGSDLSAVRTRAVADGDSFVITGEKLWSSYATMADHCLLLARTDPARAKHEGLTCFVIDLRAPGVEVRPLRQINGESDFGRIVLTEARVGPDAVVGAVDDGWQIAMTTLAHERGTFGITLIARLTLQFRRLLATVRATGMAQDPATRSAVAQLHVEVTGLRDLGYRALASVARHGRPGPESSALKLQWSHTHQRMTALAMQVLGPEAILDGDDAFWSGYWPAQRLRSRGNTIEGGTSEIIRSLIAERVAGLPRSRREA